MRYSDNNDSGYNTICGTLAIMSSNTRPVCLAIFILLGWISCSEQLKLNGRLKRADTTAMPTTNSLTASTVASTGEVPSYKVTENGQVCLRVDMVADFNIQYTVKGGVKVVKVSLPTTASVRGKCAANNTLPYIELTWDQETYLLRMDFILKNVTRPHILSKTETKWLVGAVSKIELYYNTSDDNLFPDILKSDRYAALSEPGKQFFMMPLNTSYQCNTEEHISLLSNDKPTDPNLKNYINLTLSSVRMQAFGLGSDGKFGEYHPCEADMKLPEQNLIPVIVGGCLASVILLTILGYCISKRNKQGYANMD